MIKFDNTRASIFRKSFLAAAVVGFAVCSSLASAQSANPFGVPSEKAPNPAANIVAAPGSRGQGWLGQGRSEVIARHGMVATSDQIGRAHV